MNQSKKISDPLEVGWRDEPPSFRSFAGMIRRQGAAVIVCIAASIVLTLVFIVFAGPLYTARVSLYVDGGGGADVSRSDVATAIDLDTHVELIRSESTTAAVIRSLELDREPEFATQRSMMAAIVGGLRWVLRLDAGNTGTVDPSLAVTLKVQDGLKVARNGNTRVIDLEYTSRSPGLAVAIVNAFARAYIDNMAARDEAATARRIARLSERAEEMRQKAAEADARIRTILHGSGLFTLDPQELEGQISALRQQLSEHETKVAALSAKLLIYSNFENGGDAASIDTPQGRQLLTELAATRQQLLDAHQRAGTSSNFVTATENGIKSLEAGLRQEIRFAIQAIEVERTMATAEQDNITSQIARLGDFVASDAWSELEAVRDNKVFYEGVYQDYQKQLESAGRENRSRPDLRIVADAMTPTTPSSPNIKVWLAIAMSLATLIGICIASLREWNRHERPST